MSQRRVWILDRFRARANFRPSAAHVLDGVEHRCRHIGTIVDCLDCSDHIELPSNKGLLTVEAAIVRDPELPDEELVLTEHLPSEVLRSIEDAPSLKEAAAIAEAHGSLALVLEAV